LLITQGFYSKNEIHLVLTNSVGTGDAAASRSKKFVGQKR